MRLSASEPSDSGQPGDSPGASRWLHNTESRMLANLKSNQRESTTWFFDCHS